VTRIKSLTEAAMRAISLAVMKRDYTMGNTRFAHHSAVLRSRHHRKVPCLYDDTYKMISE
jgi:hypothetical protein